MSRNYGYGPSRGSSHGSGGGRYPSSSGARGVLSTRAQEQIAELEEMIRESERSGGRVSHDDDSRGSRPPRHGGDLTRLEEMMREYARDGVITGGGSRGTRPQHHQWNSGRLEELMRDHEGDRGVDDGSSRGSGPQHHQWNSRSGGHRPSRGDDEPFRSPAGGRGGTRERIPSPGYGPRHGGGPRHADTFPGSGFGGHRNPHPNYAGFEEDDDDELNDTFIPHFPGHGGGIDPELLSGAVGTDEDMDNIISRLMAAGAGYSDGPPPASQNAIANLKKKNVDRNMLGADGKASCSVCMEDVKVRDEVTELPCKHWFHGECITEWLSSHGTCPHCRREVSSSEGPARSTPSGSRNPARPSREEDDGGVYRPRSDNGPSRPSGRRPRLSERDDEEFARSLQEQYRPSVQYDEMLARRLQEESRASVDGDAELARRLQEESRPSTSDDEALARRLQEEYGDDDY